MPTKPLISGELLGYQTSYFLAAAGIQPDRKADHASKEWKLFMAGFELAARLAGRLPHVPALPAAAQPASIDTPEFRKAMDRYQISEEEYALDKTQAKFDAAGDSYEALVTFINRWGAGLAAPAPESQPAAREAWEYSFIHSSATGRGDEEIGPCLAYDKAQAFGVGCIKQRAVRVCIDPAMEAKSHE